MIVEGNKLIKELKKELKEIQKFISSFAYKIKESFKSDVKKEYEKEPKRFNIYDYLKVYDLIQEEKAHSLTRRDRLRKERYDTNKRVQVLAFMVRNRIKSLLDYELLKDNIYEKQKNMKSQIKDLESKFNRLETLEKQLNIINDTKGVFKKYTEMDNSFIAKIKGETKENYYQKNKDSIDKYKRAKAIFDKYTDDKIKSQKDIKRLKEEVKKDIRQVKSSLYIIDSDIEELKQISYELNIASKELELDLSFELNLEIEKAIARGEKPSTVETLNRLKENKAKEERRNKAIEYRKQKGVNHKER